LRLLSSEIYGAMGSLYSLIYFTTYLADLGATNSLPPFFSYATQNKQSLKRFLFLYSFLPHIPFVLLSALGVVYFISSKFSYHPMLIIPFFLTIFETIRPFLRRFLHTAFKAKHITLSELTIFFLYIALIWIPYLIFNYPISLNYLFIVHLIDSIATTIIFVFLIFKLYKSLPKTVQNQTPQVIKAKRIITSRLFNYLLRVSRNLFTGNFITPLFAIQFGLTSAGIFYFASTIANSLQSIVKSSIGYPGSALLANLKDSPQEIKKDTFSFLCKKLSKIVAPIIIFLTINYKTIIQLGRSHDTTSYTASLFLLFLLISFTEFFFILYEQFYIIEEAANKLFFFKLMEIAMLYGIMKSPLITSPISTLVGLIIVRFINFFMIASNAFLTWRIKPLFKTTYTYLIASTAASIIFAIGFALLNN
jgi:hypothetical protein